MSMTLRKSRNRTSALVIPGSPVTGEVVRWPFFLGLVLIIETLLMVVLQPFLLAFDIVNFAIRGVWVSPWRVHMANMGVHRALRYMMLALELRIRKELHGGWVNVPKEDLASALFSAQKLRRDWWLVPLCHFGILNILVPATGPVVFAVIRQAMEHELLGHRWAPPNSLEELMHHVDNLPLKDVVVGPH